MQPYVIRQGDYLAKLAYKFGFDADDVWNDGSNADLRQARPNPNLLAPTDVLYIPTDGDPVTHNLTTGSTNAFVSDAPTVSVTIRFLDAPFASQAVSVPELPQLEGLTTGSDGTVTLTVPVTLDTFTVTFTDSGESFGFAVGGLDPVDTLSGVFQRLQNLGYLGPDAAVGDKDAIREALRAFRASQADSSSSSDDSDSSGGDSSDGGSGGDADASSDASDAGDTSSDDAGLSDDGKLDDATSSDLVTAHCT